MAGNRDLKQERKKAAQILTKDGHSVCLWCAGLYKPSHSEGVQLAVYSNVCMVNYPTLMTLSECVFR